MTTLKTFGTDHTTLSTSSKPIRWLLVSFALSFSLAASISLASNRPGTRSEAKRGEGRPVAALGNIHGPVRAGKLVAPSVKFPAEGVRPGKPALVASSSGR